MTLTRFMSFAGLTALLFVFSLGMVQAQDAKCSVGFRLIEHVGGKTCVSENPQRVVALEWTYVEDVLALGVQPVGIADIEGYKAWVKIPVELADDVVDIGDRAEPNLEVITALNPDLIIGVGFRTAQNYDELSAIAPTLIFNPYPEDLTVSQYDEMTTTFMTLATALNREAEGEAVLKHMTDYFEAAASALKEAGHGGETFILSQGWNTDNLATFRLFTDNAMAVQILQRIGLENAWDDAPQLYGFTQIGIEGFAELNDKDFNFFYVAQDVDNDIFADSPLWGGLNFVRNERAYWLGGDAWLFGGPLSAQVLVDGVLQSMGVERPVVEATAEPTLEAAMESTEQP
jgi:ferric hydroxamate transport system substrate-binding protein